VVFDRSDAGANLAFADESLALQARHPFTFRPDPDLALDKMLRCGRESRENPRTHETNMGA